MTMFDSLCLGKEIFHKRYVCTVFLMMNNDEKYGEKYSLVEGSKYHHHKIPDQENQAISVQKD